MKSTLKPTRNSRASVITNTKTYSALAEVFLNIRKDFKVYLNAVPPHNFELTLHKSVVGAGQLLERWKKRLSAIVAVRSQPHTFKAVTIPFFLRSRLGS